MNDLVELTRQHLTETPNDEEQEFLTELLSLRTGAIALGLAKTKQYATQTDQQVRNLKGNSSSLRISKTPEDTNKNLADALETIGNLF